MKHSIRRMLALLLVLSMTLVWLPAPARAESAVQTEWDTYINPLYADVITEADLAQPVSPAATEDVSEDDYAASFAEAAVSVREGMEQRQAAVVTHYKSLTYVKKDHEAIYQEAIVHTGEPTEGDSLRWVFAGYEVGISYYVGDDGMYYITYTYYMTYYTTAEQEAQLTAAVDQLLADLDVDGLNDYKKIKAIYDYMCANITYDNTTTTDLKYTAYAALVNKTAVCQGYALLFYRLALELGIDTRLIAGIGNGGAHGWNIVKLGDLYYNVDSTWDATYLQKGYDYNFFLRTDNTFEDHTRDAEFLTEDFYAAYPMATADYVYTPPTIVASGECGDNLTWTLDSEGLMVIEGTGEMWTTGSEKLWPDYLTSIKTVVIGEGVTSIGVKAFYNCSGLTDVTIPEGVTTIGGYAFGGCDSLTELVLPESVTTINAWAFCNCTSLTSVNIPKAVTFIGMHVFAGCTSLTEAHIPEGVTAILEHTFDACSALTDVTIPESVTSIGTYAFAGCSNLTSVNIPEGITAISSYTFYNCSSLAELTIPNGVTSIGKSAFFLCSSLTTVNIPESVTIIGDSAFYGCSSLTSVTLPDGVTSIVRYAFYGCSSLTGLTLPDSVASIGECAFRYCSKLTTINIPDGVTSIENCTFDGCSSLTGLTLPDSVTSIGECAFQNCSSLTELTIPEGVTAICDSTFSDCTSLASVTLPDSVTSINRYAFYGCDKLAEITIPSAVTYIGQYAFTGSSLDNVYFTGDAPNIDSKAFRNINAVCYYPVTNATWTKNIRQDYSGTLSWVPYGHFDIAMTSMTMGNSLAMNIAFEQASMDDWTGCYAEIRKTYADGREDVVVTVPSSDWKSAGISGVAHYYVTFNGIAAKEMTDDINVVIYNANGQAISNVYTDSVAAQSARILAKDTTSDEEKTMIVDMLNYGAAAQEYFGYGTDKLANADVTEEQKAYASEAKACTDIRVKGDNYVATNVVLKSNIQMMFAFQNIDTTMTSKVTFTNHRGAAKEVTINGSDFTKNGNFYVVTVDALVVADGRQAVTCVIYDADGNQVANATDSLESYTARKNGAEDIFVKMMQYSDSAYAYFHP